MPYTGSVELDYYMEHMSDTIPLSTQYAWFEQRHVLTDSVYDYLIEHAPCTIREIANALGCHPHDVNNVVRWLRTYNFL